MTDRPVGLTNNREDNTTKRSDPWGRSECPYLGPDTELRFHYLDQEKTALNWLQQSKDTSSHGNWEVRSKADPEEGAHPQGPPGLLRNVLLPNFAKHLSLIIIYF